MIKCIAFDLDGTIDNTLPLCIETFKRATQPYVAHKISDEEVIKTFGLNEEGMIKCIVNEQYWEQAINDYHVWYKRLHREMCPQPFSGILEFIATLKQQGIIVPLVTGKGAISCLITLEQFGIKDLFDNIFTGSAIRNIKADSLQKLQEIYHLVPSEIVYIGDTLSYISECKVANIKCLSAAWNNSETVTTALEKENPGNVFHSISGMSTFLISGIKS